MSSGIEIDIGARVTCEDGPCGTVDAVVIDPVAHAVTHLVVVPVGAHGLARLVPIALASSHDGAIHLSCTLAAWSGLPYVEETELVPAEVFGYEPGDWAWPYVDLADAAVPVEYDAVPPGEVELRHGARVHGADGPLGRLDGCVVDAATGRISQILVRVGRLWRRRTFALPGDSLLRVDDEGPHVRLSRRETRAADRRPRAGPDPRQQNA